MSGRAQDLQVLVFPWRRLMAHLIFMCLGRRCIFLRVRCRDCQCACSGQMHSCCPRF